MILSEFAKYLQDREEEIARHKSCTKLLGVWIKEILEKTPVTNVEKIIHAEIFLAKNKTGDFLLAAKSFSGQTLTKALYNFALSFEHHVMKKWLEHKKPDDFKKRESK